MAESDDTPVLTAPAAPAAGGWARLGRTLAVGVFALVVGLYLGIGASGLRGGHPEPPAQDSVEVGFAQDMSVHHSQAVEMSAMALTNATDPAVRTLAYDVLTTQQGQWGTMQGWLAVWDRPLQAAGEPMTWMRATEDSAGTAAGMTEHAAMPPGSAIQGPRMPGMATTSELDTLRRTTGPAFDTLYLQLLLRHHQGGLPMARYAAANATEQVVTTLARQIADTQQAESTTMQQLLTAHGAAPLPMN
ncbi:DUF305 domain-containing protein [Rhodococcus pyridinivorans]|uniref:DUF305 domain-containing protein n=5 Tax=Rhodococcus TaxID=1827 RepID=A0A419YYS2_9NOCA|nr:MULTISPECIES: DUF305 domain-containing protein [Rhodococcus]AOD24866.1 DUF305 domain-containing protein [Rhodococcus sp. p52]AYA27434.1 DUF305 domain-containing protein [Rhodococcus rhodochrous]MBX4170897.1 DUF305 domain-containing protein [Rhodococcus sp. DMU2021]MCD5422255.1 DUF305 domain-containing protein [Rhodococcus pyridinivorans]MCT7293826.1 DUF305 domain-containing protein [Rhodococcus sp. PAE-6]